MLIKRPNQTGPMTISEAPTSHVDVPSTIIDILGLPGASPDGLMFARDPRQPRTRLFGMYSPEPEWRFPKAFLDRLDVLTIDGRVLDAASWNVKRLIWRPDIRLEERDVDLGPRGGNSYAGPGWSLERRETAPDSQPITFVQALTTRAIIAVSLPARASDVVMRASTSGNGSLRSIEADVDGHPAGQLIPPAGDGYRDIVVKVPADASRSPISVITLHFDAGDHPDFVFKLDRLTIR